MTDMPEDLFVWYDHEFETFVVNEHGDKRYTPEDAKPYIRADLAAFHLEAVEMLKFIDEKISYELNPSNYDHEQVCQINSDWCEISLAVQDLLSKHTGDDVDRCKAIAAWNTRPEPAKPKVRPLFWVDTSTSFAGERYSAPTIFGVEYVVLWDDTAMTWSGFIWGEWTDYGDEGGEQEAKAAAQADYEKRILGALKWPDALEVKALPSPDELAAIIRRVDGNHDLGAALLAEKILAEL